MDVRTLSLGNRVVLGNQRATVQELTDITVTVKDENGEELVVTAMDLDKELITVDSVLKDGYSVRNMSTGNHEMKTDYVKMIQSGNKFYTVTLSNPNDWTVEILDENHNQVCTGKIENWHTLQNLISAYVFN